MNHLPAAHDMIRRCHDLRTEIADLLARTRELREELDRIRQGAPSTLLPRGETPRQPN